MQRIGVFVCHCGSNIAATVDVKKVVEVISQEPGVVHAEDYQYMCSEAGQEKIIQAIREKELTGVVVCSCSPRMHEATFRKAVAKAGLNPYMLEVANIREQCSWIHKDMEEATKKAVILARAAVAKVNLDAPLQEGESRVTKRALVIGGGIAGIQTALDVADAGYEVDIVEQRPTIGGRMAQLDKTFPTLDCAACILTPKMVEASQNEKINIISYAKVEKVSGFVGNFTATIRKKARFVDETKCTGCAACTTKCPSRKGKNEFNMDDAVRDGAYQAWGFGPMLLKDGQPMTEFDCSINSRNPRSVLGYYEPGHYCFVAVSGRRGDPPVGEGRGMTTAELSKLMYDLGCKEAYNMDGGATSMLFFDGKLVNVPAGGEGRKCSDMIYIGE